MDFETRAIHDGQEPDPATGSITVPIYQTSKFELLVNLKTAKVLDIEVSPEILARVDEVIE